MTADNRTAAAAGWALVALFVLVAVARVAATYGVFSHTYDEPTHLEAGLQLLDTGDYSTGRETPPLARLLLAAGPYLDGAHFPQSVEKHVDLAIMYGAASYERQLTLARIGSLPFFLLLLGATALWAGALAGATAAVVAVAILATLPPILGHAGLATTDIANAATVLITLYVFMRWLEFPSWPMALLLGLSGGVAVMVKFSAIPYLAAAGAPVLLWRLLVPPSERPRPARHRSAGRTLLQLGAMGLIVVAVIWLSYGTTDPLRTAIIHDKFDAGDFGARIERIAGKGTAAAALLRKTFTEYRFPVFVREIALGMKSLADHNAEGHWNYLFGEISRDGWWYYYLVELAVKTPVPLLLLGLAGFYHAMRRSIVAHDWRLAVPVLGFLAILAFVSTTSRINSGVRHILVLYPLLAIAAGALFQDLWAARRMRMLGIAVGLLVWQAVSSFLVHPDYLAYFNRLAGERPERILIDSDLDWGQDLKRLAHDVATRKIDRLSMAYYGNADVAHHIPGYRPLKPFAPATGWVAVSKTIQATSDGGYDWLAQYEPVARVGRSIDLYYIEPGQR